MRVSAADEHEFNTRPPSRHVRAKSATGECALEEIVCQLLGRAVSFLAMLRAVLLAVMKGRLIS
jgi:hypothetical protein